MECSGYCPANSECVDGLCKCERGYKGLAIMGCEGEMTSGLGNGGSRHLAKIFEKEKLEYVSPILQKVK